MGKWGRKRDKRKGKEERKNKEDENNLGNKESEKETTGKWMKKGKIKWSMRRDGVKLC